MAQSTLPVLSHSEFPQVYSAAIDEAIACVDRVLLAYSASRENTCSHQFDESCGPAAGLSCSNAATITCLEDEQPYCGKCFREVSRG